MGEDDGDDSGGGGDGGLNTQRLGLPAAPPTPTGQAAAGYGWGVGVNPNSDTYAGDAFAAVTREQWANYVGTFIPIENQLIDYATDPTVVSDAMAGASEGVNNAFDAQQGVMQRRLQGLGVSLSADEQQAQTLGTGLSRSLADVQAQNVARDMTVQRQQGILGAPAPQGIT